MSKKDGKRGGVGKDGYGKGDLPRDGFDYKTFEQNYERIYHPRCKGCGTITAQRAGWMGSFYCINNTCEYYNKVFRR